MAFAFLESCIQELQSTPHEDSSDSEDGSDIVLNDGPDFDADDSRSTRSNGVNSDNDDSDDGSDIEVDQLDQHPVVNDRNVWTEQVSNVNLEEFTEFSGPVHHLDEMANPLDYFRLFITDQIVENIVVQTNLYAEQIQAVKGTDKYWKPVNSDDIRKYFYVNIMFGIHDVPNYRLIWSEDKMLRVDAIADVMGRQRYEKITQYFHLNDSSMQPGRTDENFDPLYKIRPLLDHVRSVSTSVYKPQRQISIDEAMVAFTGRLYFIQYIRNKPTPWGLKVWCVAEAKTGYLLNFQFYTGKSTEPMPDGIGHHVIMNTASDYLDKYHVFYYDNYFSSVRLAEDLLQRQTYSCATTRPNRKEWPFRKTAPLKQKGAFKMLQRRHVTATTWTDKRNVNIISTSSNPTMTTVPRRTKNGVEDHPIPTPVLDYNEYMGGVDLADQYRSYYKVGRAGKKWWRYAFCFLIQTSIINAFLLMRASVANASRNSPARQHPQFRISLLKSLLIGCNKPTKSARPENPTVTGMATPFTTKHNLIRVPGRKKRCYWCTKTKAKTESGRCIETVFGCELCKIHLCKGICFTTYHENL